MNDKSMRIYPISFEQMKKKNGTLLLNPQIKIDSLHLKPVFIIYLIVK